MHIKRERERLGAGYELEKDVFWRHSVVCGSPLRSEGAQIGVIFTTHCM